MERPTDEEIDRLESACQHMWDLLGKLLKDNKRVGEVLDKGLVATVQVARFLYKDIGA